MSTLARVESDLVRESGLEEGRPGSIYNTAPNGDSIIVIHLGPGQTPEVARILRSQWPTITALNYAQAKEFHVRLRQHKGSGVCLVYASVSINAKNRNQKSIFGDVIQRGRLAKTPEQIKAGIEEIRRELGIERTGMMGP